MEFDGLLNFSSALTETIDHVTFDSVGKDHARQFDVTLAKERRGWFKCEIASVKLE